MRINEIQHTKAEFVSFLGRLSENPFREFEALGRGVDHAVIRIGGVGPADAPTVPSLHIVGDAEIYRSLQNLPRADYMRQAMTEKDGIIGLHTAPHDAHHARKDGMMDHFKHGKVAESVGKLGKIVDTQIAQWRRAGTVKPFAASQIIAAEYFSKFAFGTVPSPQDVVALARSSVLSSEANLYVLTDPRHFPCLAPFANTRAPRQLSEQDQGMLADKKKWIEKLIGERCDRDQQKSLLRKPRDLLDVVIRQAIVAQGGELKGTLGGQVKALTPAGRRKAGQQAAKDVSFLMAAATETTPTLIAYATHMAAHDKKLQDALRQELAQNSREICKGNGFNVHDLLSRDKMPVLQGLISDALTRYPPTPFAPFPRQVDAAITVKGIDFKKGDIVVFDLSKLQRPFHAGEYMCAGKHVAEMEASVVLAKTFGALRLEPYPGGGIPEPKRNSLVSTPAVDVPLKVAAL